MVNYSVVLIAFWYLRLLLRNVMKYTAECSKEEKKM